ncbi:MAG: hypothetical protein Q7U20_09015 [Caulobacter sp.]|nr:hypothetical protein [Caulobacter sp.]
MDRTLIASTVAERLFATETAVEDAMAQAVSLMRGMIGARRALGLPSAMGDPALRRVSAALSALGEAQREIVRTHGELETLRKEAGLRVVGFGPLLKPLTGAAESQPAD